MRAWQVTEWCEPEGMSLNELEPPVPGNSQVLIRNHAAALNFFDLLQIQGKYQVKPPFPFTPGAEVAGVVESVGPDVKGVAKGDRVLAMTNGGGFAEMSIAEANRTFPIPRGMTFAEAAAMPIVYHTSWLALHRRAYLRPGEWLLVHAGASGVGMSAIQIGKALGARVIATAGDDRKLEFAREQGAEAVVSYRTEDWVERVQQLTGGRGADVIYDPVGGDIFGLSTKCLAPEGRLLVIGFAGGRIPSIQANRILLKNISVVGVFWGGYVGKHPEYLVEAQQALANLYGEGKIHPRVGQEYTLDQGPQGLQDLAARKIVGKAIITF